MGGVLRPNEGHVDRGVRLTLGVLSGIVALTAAPGSLAAVLATALTIVLFATAAVGRCPLYALLKIDTARSLRSS